jgi:glycosyltransferase involved in cell wall biosynthesis
MEKFSVIIPTIWQSKYITPLLEELSQCEWVGEIILIDNTDYVLYPGMGWDFPKVQLVKEMVNTYVNPAWNKGISMAKNDYVTICNDDIIFNVNEYFNYLTQAFNVLDIGFIGSHSENYTDTIFEECKIETYDNKTNTGGWGCLFSFNKNIWKPIPEQLKIWYGDNWIHGTNPNIFQLKGINIKTKMSTSSDMMSVRPTRDNDTIEWMKLINNK